jgi:DNA repair exonuclease SbcCD ATPase subunit
MTDQQLLKDIQYLKNSLEVSFNELIKQSKRLFKEAQQKEKDIHNLIDKHQQDIKKLSLTIEKIGGSEQLETLLNQIKTTHELLNTYSNVTSQISQDFNEYQNLANQIQKQSEKCSLAESSLLDAYFCVEELSSFCNELLEIRQFLQGVQGFTSLFSSIQEVKCSIQIFQEQQQNLETDWNNIYDRGSNLLTQLQQCQDSAQALLSGYQQVDQQVTALEELVSSQAESLISLEQKLTGDFQAKTEQLRQRDDLQNENNQKLSEKVNLIGKDLSELLQEWHKKYSDFYNLKQQIISLTESFNIHDSELKKSQTDLSNFVQESMNVKQQLQDVKAQCESQQSHRNQSDQQLAQKIEDYKQYMMIEISKSKQDTWKKTVLGLFLGFIGGLVGSFIMMDISPTLHNEKSQPSGLSRQN